MQGKADLRDAGERAESVELRFRHVARYEKLLRRPQAREVLEETNPGPVSPPVPPSSG